MISYNAKTKIYKCLMKDESEVLLREEHLDLLKNNILEKTYVGNLAELEFPVYDNLFYTD